jgi:cytochrome c biogenesis protein CcmG/thiol:disulfide interchange protein DsbE
MERQLKVGRYAFLLALTLATAQAACGGDSAEAPGAASPAAGGLIGQPAPDFTVAAVVNGKGKVALGELRGKVVLVDFWGTFCEPCKQSFPKLQDLHTKYGSSGLRIVGISEDDADSKGEIPAFASSLGAKFTLGWDEDKSLARSYKPPTMPSSFLIDRKGVVRYVHAGYHDGDELHVDKEIKELLAE